MILPGMAICLRIFNTFNLQKNIQKSQIMPRFEPRLSATGGVPARLELISEGKEHCCCGESHKIKLDPDKTDKSS